MEIKKIGIISYWDSKSNYGQILQGVALQYILKSLGFYPVTMKYAEFNLQMQQNSD